MKTRSKDTKRTLRTLTNRVCGLPRFDHPVSAPRQLAPIPFGRFGSGHPGFRQALLLPLPRIPPLEVLIRQDMIVTKHRLAVAASSGASRGGGVVLALLWAGSAVAAGGEALLGVGAQPVLRKREQAAQKQTQTQTQTQAAARAQPAAPAVPAGVGGLGCAPGPWPGRSSSHPSRAAPPKAAHSLRASSPDPKPLPNRNP